MWKRWTKRLLLGFIGICGAGYVAIALFVSRIDLEAPAAIGAPAPLASIAILGASGTAGDGILKAALANPDLDRIHVITRRATPRIDEGVASGKVIMTTHMDYLDYSAVIAGLADVDAVYWAIGLSSIGIDEDTYRRIHIDFPVSFFEQWLSVTTRPRPSFHYISSSDISEDASAMWARVKVEAENALFDRANGSSVRVIAYRPDYIGPTAQEARLGQRMLYGFFAPLGVAVKAEEIGRAMLEVSLRGEEFENGDKVGTFGIRRYAGAFESRQSSAAVSGD